MSPSGWVVREHRSEPRPRQPHMRLVIGLLFASATGCSVGEGTEVGTLPPAISPSMGASERAAFLEYAATLTYDLETHGVADREFLDTVVSGKAVPTDIVGTIVPASNSHKRTLADLSGSGGLHLRIDITTIDGNPHPAGYSPLGLPPGTSYVWIDSLKMDTDSTGTGRALIIPADPSRAVVVRPFWYTHHPS